MENFLRSKEYWSLLEIGYAEQEQALTVADRRRLYKLNLKDLKCKNCLFQAIDRTILEIILEKST